MLRRIKQRISESKANNVLYQEEGAIIGSNESITATFSRNSEAYKSDGTVVGADEPIYNDTNDAILIEEGTTNLLTDPNFETNTDWFYGDGSTVTTNKYGDNSFIVASTATAGTTRGYVQKIIDGVTEGTSYTGRVLARATGLVDNCQVRLSWYDANDSFVAGNYTTISGDLTSEWKEFEITRTAPVGATKVHFYPVYDGGSQLTNFEVEMTQPQLENKAYSTSYTEGTRDKTSLTLPSNVLNTNEATIELELYPLLDSDLANGTNGHDLCWMDENPNFNGFIVRREANAVKLLVLTDGAIDNYSYSKTWNAGDKLSYAIKWDFMNVYLYLNGELIFTKNKFGLPTSQLLQIGSRDFSNSMSGNAYYSKLKVSNRAKSTEEISNAYADGMEIDSNTVVFMNFEGNLDVIGAGGLESYPIDISDFKTIKSLKLIANHEKESNQEVNYFVSLDGGVTWIDINNYETLSNLSTTGVLVSRVAISSDDTTSPKVFDYELVVSDGENNYLVIERTEKFEFIGADKMDLYVGETKDVQFDVRNRDGQSFTISSSTYELIDEKGSVTDSGSCTVSGKTVTATLDAPNTKGIYELRVKFVIGSENLIKMARVYVK